MRPTVNIGSPQDHDPGDGKGSRPHESIGLLVQSDECGRVLADVRERIARNERSPVLARHLTALGFDEVVLAMARES